MKEGDGFDDHGSDSNRELPVTLQLGFLVDRQALESDAMAIRQIAEPVKCCKTLFLIHFNFFQPLALAKGFSIQQKEQMM